MRIVKYTHFYLETKLEETPTVDNFFKYNIKVQVEGELPIHISKTEVSLQEVESLLSGDEAKAKEAIATIIRNRLWELNILKKISK